MMRALKQFSRHAGRTSLPAHLVPKVHSPLDRLAEANVVGIVYSRNDGTIVDANDAFLRTVGYTRQEFEQISLRWPDLTPPEWMEISRQAMTRANATGAASTFEKEYLRKDGSRVPVLIAVALLSRSKGASIHFVTFIVDMTERKAAEAERDRLMMERVAMLESAGDGIYGLDQDGRCTFMNRAAAQMLGYEPKDCLGRSMHQLIHSRLPDGSVYPEQDCPVYRVYRTGTGGRSDNQVLWRRDGTSFPIEGSAFPIVVNGKTERRIKQSPCSKNTEPLQHGEHFLGHPLFAPPPHSKHKPAKGEDVEIIEFRILHRMW